MRGLLVGLTAVAVLALAAPALAQDPVRPFAVTPSSVSHVKRFTLVGYGWGAALGTTCSPIRVQAAKADGTVTRSLTAFNIGPTATTFRRVMPPRKLPVGTWTLTASQSCSKELGGGGQTAIAKLTVF
jgi:hypothetical protein